MEKKVKPHQNPIFDMETKEKKTIKRAKESQRDKPEPRGKSTSNAGKDFCQYRHNDMRVNNPPVGLVNSDSDPDGKKKLFQYDPHIDPALQFDSRWAHGVCTIF